MGRAGFTRLRVFVLTFSFFVVAFVESQNVGAQVPESELSVTLVCVDIESSTYKQFQQSLDSLAKARNCQRSGLQRHELTGVFESKEIRNAITSLVDAGRANVCWFDQAKTRRDRYVDIPTGPWVVSRSGSNFVEARGHLELYRGESSPNFESIGIRAGMYRQRSWPGGGGVPGILGGPGPDFVKVRPGQTIVIADRPANWPDSIFLGADDEYKEQLRQQDAAVLTRRLMLLEVPPRIRSVQRPAPGISSPGYAVRPSVPAGR